MRSGWCTILNGEFGACVSMKPGTSRPVLYHADRRPGEVASDPCSRALPEDRTRVGYVDARDVESAPRGVLDPEAGLGTLRPIRATAAPGTPVRSFRCQMAWRYRGKD